jgi:hypothetical protein
MSSVIVTIRGKHDTGKSTLASLFKMFLEENGYKHVKVEDVPPMPAEMKAPFWDRFCRNRETREILIRVELLP